MPGPAIYVTLFTVLCIGSMPAQRNATAGKLQEVEQTLPGLVAERMRRGNLPGVAIVVVQGERVVYAQGFGRKNLVYPDPITPESVFRVASLTKQFVAMACLLLEREGKMKLTDPVVKHVPAFATRSGAFGKITVGQLLSHQSGLPRGPYYGGEHGTVVEQVEDLARLDLTFAPGTAYKYSNCGYNLAGHVVEVVSGMPFPEFVDKRILEPLRSGAGFALTPALSNHYATGYMTDHYRSFVSVGDELRAAPLYPAPLAAGQLFASALDVSRFLRCLLHEGTTGGVELLPKQLFERMVTPFSELSSYGLGLGLAKLWDRPVFQHTGGYYGHSSLVIGFPGEKIGGVCLVNRASSHHENRLILHTALALLLGEEPPALSADPGLAGLYRDGEQRIEVVARGSDLYWYEDGRVHRLEPVYGASTRYALSGGRYARWPVDFSGVRAVAGPHVLWRQGHAPPATLTADELSLQHVFCGVYRDDDFGDVEVFLRDGKLHWAFSKAEQVVLDPVDNAVHRFRITTGSFRGEELVFHIDNGRAVRLQAGGMEFKRANGV